MKHRIGRVGHFDIEHRPETLGASGFGRIDEMNYAALIKAISTATVQLQGRAAATLNQALVIRNWMVGAWVIEFEQTGKDRAKYGARLLETQAHDLKERGLKGLDERSLLDCRSVYRLYPQIPGSLTPELAKLLKSQRFPSNQSSRFRIRCWCGLSE